MFKFQYLFFGKFIKRYLTAPYKTVGVILKTSSAIMRVKFKILTLYGP
jgi:hypothetical protein